MGVPPNRDVTRSGVTGHFTVWGKTHRLQWLGLLSWWSDARKTVRWLDHTVPGRTNLVEGEDFCTSLNIEKDLDQTTGVVCCRLAIREYLSVVALLVVGKVHSSAE